MCSGASAKVKSTGTSLPLVPVWGIAHILPLPAASEWRGATLSAALSRDCRISKRILDKPLMGTRNGKTCHATGAAKVIISSPAATSALHPTTLQSTCVRRSRPW